MVRMSGDYSTEVEVNVEQLLGILRENKDAHVEQFEEAVETYKRRGVEALERRAEELRRGQTLSLTFRLVEPVNYASEYDTIIGMLELHSATTITLGYQEYRQFVQNEWAWSSHFAANTQVYLAE